MNDSKQNAQDGTPVQTETEAMIDFLNVIIAKSDRKTIARLCRLVSIAVKERRERAELDYMRAVQFDRKADCVALLEWLGFYTWIADAAQRVLLAAAGGVSATLTLHADADYVRPAVATIGPDFAAPTPAGAVQTERGGALVGQMIVCIKDSGTNGVIRGDHGTITGYAGGSYTVQMTDANGVEYQTAITERELFGDGVWPAAILLVK